MTGKGSLAACALLCALTPSAQDPLPVIVAEGILRPGGAPLVTVSLALTAPLQGTIEIVRLGRSDAADWRIAAVARVSSPAATSELRIAAPAGTDSLIVIRVEGRAGYLLEGPLRWPSEPSTVHISGAWRRTVRGQATRASGAPPVWVSGADDGPPGDGWPHCAWHGGESWECIGVPLAAPGVVILVRQPRVIYAVGRAATDRFGIERVNAYSSGWGRLVSVTAGSPEPNADPQSPPGLTALRTEVPATRPQSVRGMPVKDVRVSVLPVGPRAFWLNGADVPESTWIEVTQPGMAPARLPLPDVAGAPPELAERVALVPAVAIFGRVIQAGGRPVTRAVVSLYRFPEGPRDPGKLPIRLMVAEQKSNADGAFRFDALAGDRHEVVVMHATLGQGMWELEPAWQPVDLVLTPRAQAIGQVVREGAPAAGVRVVVMPDLAEFASAEDPLTLAGGETQTDHDGRFRVALPARGHTELRIGGEADGLRRVTIGPAESARGAIDVGTIDLSRLPPISLVLEASDGCELLLTGPASRAGMTMVRARRVGASVFEAGLPEPGRWFVVATCARTERSVIPAFIDATGVPDGVSVRLTWGGSRQTP